LENFRLPSEIPEDEWPLPEVFINEATECVAAARDEGITIRVMGGIAIFMHSREYQPLWEKLGRLGKKVFTDIDYVSYGKHRVKLIDFFKKRNFIINQKLLYLYGKNRQIYYSRKIPMAEIFFDRLEMNHTVDFKKRLGADFPTISLSELLLQKLQMVNMNEKDIKDTIILLRAHEIGTSDDNVINEEAIGARLLTDWGFYYTATNNLKMVEQSMKHYPVLQAEDVQVVTQRLEALLCYLDESPKSLKWKARSVIGTKVKWYNEVDEWDVIESPSQDSRESGE